MSPTLLRRLKIELKPKQTTRSDTITVPEGTVWYIRKVFLRDGSDLDFKLTLCPNTAQPFEKSANTVRHKPDSFSEVGLESGSYTHFKATPLSTLKSLVSLELILEIEETDSKTYQRPNQRYRVTI